MQRLKHGDVIALLGKIARAGEARGAGADHGHLVPVGRRLRGRVAGVVVVPVGNKALQSADAHRLALNAADAVFLALALLRADPAAHGGQGAGLGNDLIRLLKVALGNLGDKLGNMYHYRATGHTGLVLAVKAAQRFVQRHLLGISQRDLFIVLVADIGVLRGHGVFLQRHIRHITRPPC
ncbi:hypothetical protein SDC9_132003 [bioreactor metagenome]|uniref:Uncharacterized protein n=1 Tax=bioreactor metagenome TaxID=1076179 RepID=A0A645D6X7_9ZZZZ